MSPALQTFLLCLPFCIALIAAGVPFCLKGYKKGLWRSLISLGVTIVSAALSMVLANLLAMLLADPLSGSLYNVLEDTLGFGEILQTLLHTASEGIARILLASVLFVSFFLLFSLVGKILIGRIKSAPLDQNAKKPGMKWSGLGVRVLDTLLFALLLPLPFYGAIAAYMPAAEALVELSHEEIPQDRELFLPESYTTRAMDLVGDILEETPYAEECISAAAHHPIVKIYSVPPFSTVYAGMSYISIDDDTLNLSRSVHSMTEFTKQYCHLLSVPEDQFEESLAQFSTYLQDDVIDSDWFYVFCVQSLQQLCNGLEDSISHLSQPEDQATFTAQLTQWRGLTGISESQFREVNRILPLAAELSVQQADKNTDAYRDKLTELGALLSATQEALDLKQAVFMTFINFNDEIPSPLRQDMLDRYHSAPYTNADMQRKDAEAFLLLLKNFRNASAEQIADILKQVPEYEYSEILIPKLGLDAF